MAIRLQLCTSATLEPGVRAAMEGVFVRAFQVDGDPGQCLEPYFQKVESVLLAWDRSDLLGFQFYQSVAVDGETVHHFSLAGRLPDLRARGLQGKFGRFLIQRCIWRTLPWRPVWIAGVSNNWRSYFNMRAIGGRLYPDVLHPDAGNSFGAFYTRVATALSLPAPDERGILRNRMQGLGFGLRDDNATDKRGTAYAAYLGGDLRHGLFALIRIVPLIDVPAYVLAGGRRQPKLLLAEVASR